MHAVLYVFSHLYPSDGHCHTHCVVDCRVQLLFCWLGRGEGVPAYRTTFMPRYVCVVSTISPGAGDRSKAIISKLNEYFSLVCRLCAAHEPSRTFFAASSNAGSWATSTTEKGRWYKGLEAADGLFGNHMEVISEDTELSSQEKQLHSILDEMQAKWECAGATKDNELILVWVTDGTVRPQDKPEGLSLYGCFKRAQMMYKCRLRFLHTLPPCPKRSTDDPSISTNTGRGRKGSRRSARIKASTAKSSKSSAMMALESAHSNFEVWRKLFEPESHGACPSCN